MNTPFEGMDDQTKSSEIIRWCREGCPLNTLNAFTNFKLLLYYIIKELKSSNLSREINSFFGI